MKTGGKEVLDTKMVFDEKELVSSMIEDLKKEMNAQEIEVICSFNRSL